ncbi:MAG: phenylalanine--tRNA ligase subunit alpha [archaeon]
MDFGQKVQSLSGIEAKTLKALDAEKFEAVEEIAKRSGLPIDSVRRSLEWLKEKAFIDVSEEKSEEIVLTAVGKSSLGKALPERLFAEALQQLNGKGSLEDVFKKSQLNRPEFNVAMGLAKKNAWISIRAGKETLLEFTGLEKDFLEGNYPLEKAMKKIGEMLEPSNEEKKALEEALKRGLVEKIVRAEKKARINAEGKKALELLSGVKGRAYDIQGEVPKIFAGKRQAYEQFLDSARAKLIAMGFREMESPLITQEFYNFDALFQPQGHPARQWTDTYQLKQPRFGKLPDKRIVEQVKACHENGWKTGSKGWGYEWSEEIAKKVMPAAHGTAHSARQLVKGVEVPGKYFAIARCYRPDVVDASHLIEFNQMEGIIVGKDLNFRHLLGMLKEFAVEITEAKSVKFSTGYYPFTEPSCELYIEHPKIGWLEIGGAGIFRPELTTPLGAKEPVLAWGLGIDRLAMIKMGIKDIRQLFSQDLNWLRNMPIV